MSKQKNGPLDDAEKARLLSIQRGPNQKKFLTKAAKTFKREYNALYAAWSMLLKENNLWGTPGKSAANVSPAVRRLISSPQKGPVVAVPAKKGNEIVAYVLEEGADVGGRGETEVLRDKLRPLIEKMDVYDPTGTRHAIPIETSKAGSLRTWLQSEFTAKDFKIVSIHDNQKMSRIIRKA
jgi:hypothetical protein